MSRKRCPKFSCTPPFEYFHSLLLHISCTSCQLEVAAKDPAGMTCILRFIAAMSGRRRVTHGRSAYIEAIASPTSIPGIYMHRSDLKTTFFNESLLLRGDWCTEESVRDASFTELPEHIQHLQQKFYQITNLHWFLQNINLYQCISRVFYW